MNQHIALIAIIYLTPISIEYSIVAISYVLLIGLDQNRVERYVSHLCLILVYFVTKSRVRNQLANR